MLAASSKRHDAGFKDGVCLCVYSCAQLSVFFLSSLFFSISL